MTLSDALFAVWLANVLALVAMLCTKRVIIAWMVYFGLRWRPPYRTSRGRRWLWLRTLAAANGDDRDHLARPNHRARRRR